MTLYHICKYIYESNDKFSKIKKSNLCEIFYTLKKSSCKLHIYEVIHFGPEEHNILEAKT